MNNAHKAAATILLGFDSYFERFQNITEGAQRRFEEARWLDVQEQSRQRIDLYKTAVTETLDELKIWLNDDITDREFLRKVKQAYTQLMVTHANFELAETFFNSIFCQFFDHRDISDSFMYISATSAHDHRLDRSLARNYPLAHGITQSVHHMLDDCHFHLPFEDRERDIGRVAEVLANSLAEHGGPSENTHLEIIKSLFFRNKGAYVVGRIIRAHDTLPFIMPVLNNGNNEIYVDTVILDTDDVSIIFSFTHSYFMVISEQPSRLVQFLKEIMPHKGRSELYASIGHNKHGKTEFYREFLEHMAHSSDEFIIAPGIKGMVMSVFTLPSYDIVFKVIKDRFDPPKEMTRETVKEKYKLISRHDRIGRMADTQEFSYLRFEKKRFSQDLLDELQKVAPSQLLFDGDDIIIKHLYTERKMTPLNLYLQDATDLQIEEAMDEYGSSIKQIASANIFPGDMLLKNFGVTRHGRVVFYDYDEICFLTDCSFRYIPEPQTEEQEMSATPWYPVDANDVFPEEFRIFFTGNPKARQAFEKYHSDLYDTAYWRGLQDRIRHGHVEDMFPYRRRKRFPRPDIPAQ